MTRAEAIAIAHGDKDVIVEILLHLSARVAELERQVALLTKDSSNSSKPPSSDGPTSKLKDRRSKSHRRKRGRRPGHKGSNRALVPEEEVDRVIELFPDHCAGCGKGLGSDDEGWWLTGKYFRSQVVDIPEPKPTVTEFQRHCVKCSCGAETWAALPGEAKSAFGPRLGAFLAYLSAVHRVTRRGCKDIAKTIFGIDMSLGAVCKLQEEVSGAVGKTCDEIKEALAGEAVLNGDETGWRTDGQRRWLWVLAADALAFFHISPSRGSKVLREVLGETFQGTLCSDMYSAYKAYHKGERQYCWSHIIRSIRGVKHACRSPDGVVFSRWMLTEIGRMFGLWHAFRRGHLERETLVRRSVPIRASMKRCLTLYAESPDLDVKQAAKSLSRHWDGLFTFLSVDGVEPTNNSAERAVRPAVQWRKISF